MFRSAVRSGRNSAIATMGGVGTAGALRRRHLQHKRVAEESRERVDVGKVEWGGKRKRERRGNLWGWGDAVNVIAVPIGANWT